MAMDLAIRYVFADGKGVLFVLVEHWSSAGKLDLLRTARYYLDLCRRFPADEILPIALVDDDTSTDPTNAIQRGAMGDVFLSFRTRIVQVPALDLAWYRETRNRVALSFLPNMRGDLDPVERVVLVALAFHQQQDTEGLRRFFAFWVVEGRLELVQQRDLERRLKEMDMPEIITWWLEEGEAKGVSKGIEVGRQEGIRTSNLENTRKMREHGIPWEIVTDVTGIKPEDLA
ncbi:MAG TPA: hypothetical protein VN931_04105 [Fibrobacteria bacterium]|nr:hypothetical protein [Fibrobacteria bacterium]